MTGAYLKFMKNVATNVEKRVEHITQHAVEVIQKDDATPQDVDSVWQEIKDLNADLGSEASDAAADEIKERLIEQYRARGMSPDDASQLFEERWKQILDRSEYFREIHLKPPKPIKWLWLKIVGASAIAAMVIFAIQTGNHEGNGLKTFVVQVDTEHDAMLSLQVSMNQQQFDNLLANLGVGDYPTVEVPAPAVELPALVQVIAATPVTGTVNRSNGASQTVQTNIGTLYRAVPQARRRIVNYTDEPHNDFHGNISVKASWDGGPTASFRW